MSYRTVQSTKQCLHSYWQQSLVMFTEDRAPERVFDKCYERLEAADFLLRQWTALCFAQMWDDDDIKVYGVDRGTQDKLIAMLSDDSAEVQSPALYALGTGVSNTLRRTSSFANALKSLANGIAFPSSLDDGRASPTISTHVHFQSEVADISRPPSPNLNVAQYASPYSRPVTHREVTAIVTKRHIGEPLLHLEAHMICEVKL
ncbi:hypothetical protein K443DRAFT_6304 [Laccaria amethystina LaAM-08-1]|uniref:Uncharacterized protein n=1 Tax=Laccaria amethystina LaAM-08-1 TaxID=1095629 RepID=A0A0C9Y2D9_9AGAR|nr:hypothetical protein K443DRAFT_6304 [Laccaria amethystina LaAM-08-1]